MDALNAVRLRSEEDEEQAQLGRWFRENRGADVSFTQVRLTLQGVDQNVAVAGLRAIVRERTAVLDGGFLSTEPGGESPPIKVELNLDERRPTAAYFQNKTITVAVGETVVIDVFAEVAKSTVTWDIALDFVVSGKRRTVVVKANTAHFRTTGQAKDYQSWAGWVNTGSFEEEKLGLTGPFNLE